MKDKIIIYKKSKSDSPSQNQWSEVKSQLGLFSLNFFNDNCRINKKNKIKNCVFSQPGNKKLNKIKSLTLENKTLLLLLFLNLKIL